MRANTSPRTNIHQILAEPLELRYHVFISREHTFRSSHLGHLEAQFQSTLHSHEMPPLRSLLWKSLNGEPSCETTFRQSKQSLTLGWIWLSLRWVSNSFLNELVVWETPVGNHCRFVVDCWVETATIFFESACNRRAWISRWYDASSRDTYGPTLDPLDWEVPQICLSNKRTKSTLVFFRRRGEQSVLSHWIDSRRLTP